ncbi:MAG TPA: Uma2 family endonuclease [Candidatus Binatia bacterium]|nr:Uma2 family endonuclease [Candidatus Binatia bacterium]
MEGPRRRATYQDLLEIPDHLVAEIADGELFVSPRPASPHAHATSVLGSDVIGQFHGPPGGAERPGGWWVLFEPELHLDDDVLVPDLAAWRRTRMPVLPNVAAFTEPPDWVCEVVSPTTARLDRARKTRIYARARVGHLWLVDPRACTLEVYRLEAGRWVLVDAHEGNGPVRAEPFEVVELVLGRWWIEDVASAAPRGESTVPGDR